jgi:hypothetical protein
VVSNGMSAWREGAARRQRARECERDLRAIVDDEGGDFVCGLEGQSVRVSVCPLLLEGAHGRCDGISWMIDGWTNPGTATTPAQRHPALDRRPRHPGCNVTHLPLWMRECWLLKRWVGCTQSRRLLQLGGAWKKRERRGRRGKRIVIGAEDDGESAQCSRQRYSSVIRVTRVALSISCRQSGDLG